MHVSLTRCQKCHYHSLFLNFLEHFTICYPDLLLGSKTNTGFKWQSSTLWNALVTEMCDWNESWGLWKAISAICGNATCFKHLNLCPISPQVNLFQGSLPQTYHDPYVCHRDAGSQLLPRCPKASWGREGRAGKDSQPIPQEGRKTHSRLMVGRWRAPGDMTGEKGILRGTRHPTGKHPTLQVMALLMGEIRCWDVCAPGSWNPPCSQPSALCRISVPQTFSLWHSSDCCPSPQRWQLQSIFFQAENVGS